MGVVGGWRIVVEVMAIGRKELYKHESSIYFSEIYEMSQLGIKELDLQQKELVNVRVLLCSRSIYNGTDAIRISLED